MRSELELQASQAAAAQDHGAAQLAAQQAVNELQRQKLVAAEHSMAQWKETHAQVSAAVAHTQHGPQFCLGHAWWSEGRMWS